ncbi:MAG: hypothetical protein ACRDDY_00075 [Clostridium sp.]|uniref:hypothetical protein n=1 Tax=Clostridium sp. TaxID=1506 RepID=UPI003EE7E2AD
MDFLIITVSIVGIVFMLTFMFIGIWLFIVGLKAYNQMRYKNYILEKIHEKLTIISHSNSKKSSEEEAFLEDVSDLLDISEFENIKEFEKRDHLK